MTKAKKKPARKSAGRKPATKATAKAKTVRKTTKAAPKPIRKAAAKKVARKKTVKVAPKTADKKPARNKGGQPTKYTKNAGELVCRYLVAGYTLRQIEKQAKMPTKTTIINWIAAQPEFFDQYVRAREAQALVTEDTIQEIADDSRNDWVEREGQGKGAEAEMVLQREAIERSKLRIETIKWLASKRNPKRYGKTSLELSGPNGGPIKTQEVLSGIMDEIDGAGTGLDGSRED